MGYQERIEVGGRPRVERIVSPARVVLTPGTCGGRPRIDGSRFDIDTVIAYIGAGWTERDFLEDFDWMPLDTFDVALNWATANGFDVELLVRRVSDDRSAGSHRHH
jgi:uncharacterized protein (DUF433 family)